MSESNRVGKWVSTQTHNSDPQRRDAALHICSRWDVTSPWFDFAKSLRTLIREDSEHATGARLLAADYVGQFMTPKEAEEAGADPIRGLALAGPLVPIESLQCDYTWLHGDRTYHCRRDSIPGSDRCGRHGGQYMSAEDAKAISAHTSARILDATDRAVRTLIELMDEGRSELVRLQAATSILDRAGIGPSQTVEVNVGGDTDAAALIRQRLERMARPAIEPGDDDIEDAEVVSEDDAESERVKP